MKKKTNKDTTVTGDGWCFAIVNGRLGEIHFRKGIGIWAHSYEDRTSYKTKAEQRMIDADIKKYQFTYRKGYYFDKIRGTKQKVPSERKVFPELYDKNTKWYTLEDLKELK